jgi:lipoprotein signal peptidase
MKTVLILVLFAQIGCAAIADITIQSVAGAIGGTLGNMADRRVEEKLKKEKDNECKDCEADKR